MKLGSYSFSASTCAIIFATIASSLAFVTPAQAQNVSTGPGGDRASVAGQQGGQAVSDSGVQDIVVTAQRRSESVQKSSVSIEVLDSKRLLEGGITSAKDLATLTAGVQIGQGGAETQIYIRGVGDFGGNVLAQGSVSFNIDGVAVGSPSSFGPEFYDLERVEILKGPQGTLYGRNSSGGAVNLLTARPKHEFSGYLQSEVGNYDLVRLTGAVNVPISSTLAMRASFQGTHRDGYLSDGTNDDKSVAGRVHVLWEPSADVSLLVTGSAAHVGGKGQGAAQLPVIDGDPWLGTSDPKVSAYYNSIGVASLPDNARLRNDLRNISAELNANLGFAKLTFIPAYRYGKIDVRHTSLGFPAQDKQTSKQTSMELRLSNETDKWKWVIGGFFFDMDQLSDLYVDQRPVQYVHIDVPNLGTRSYAAFADATYSLTPSFRLLGGLRYTHEKRSIDGTVTVTNSDGSIGSGLLGTSYSGSKVTWKAGFEYDVAPRSMLYGTVSTGFKAGGVNFAPSGPEATYKPERITAYTIGSRNRFFDNKVQLNLEGFYWDYRDHQENVLGPVSGGLVLVTLRNAGKATIYGGSADLVVKPSNADTLHFAVEYVHSRYDSFLLPTADGGPPSAAQTGCKDAGSGYADCSGFQLLRAPTWSGSARYEHRFDLANGGTITPSFDLTFASSRWLQASFLAPNALAPAYATGNVQLNYEAPGERFSAGLWMRNIWNEAVYTSAEQSFFASSHFFANIGAPRTYGVRAGIKF
ncbi:TonB-dependent receptor [Novosphingobium sp.]|uniref:TonB-dependent receptor n=1 Tax=Novosphingobium sp. TaxID=1874826 RepID=UPI002FE0AF59